MAVVARHLGKAHLIERDRDGADGILREHKAHQSRKLLRVKPRLPKHFHKLIEHIAENVPELRELLRPLRISALPERFGLPL